MARIIEDAGATAAILKPLALPVFEPDSLPDPVSCVRSAIIINDRHNGELVPRLAISTGAAWLRLAVLSDLGNTSPVDVTPIVERTTREEIARALPAIVQQALPAPRPGGLPAPADADLYESVRAQGALLLEVTAELNRLREYINAVASEAAATGARVVEEKAA
ncbi:MAG: hypothetical protein IPK59_23320 [Rhodospirillaceae bacterium]|nr:hypothetical protein [Rhodospirillaceae bacterium]